jgi:hypothetical protein
MLVSDVYRLGVLALTREGTFRIGRASAITDERYRAKFWRYAQ